MKLEARWQVPRLKIGVVIFGTKPFHEGSTSSTSLCASSTERGVAKGGGQMLLRVETPTDLQYEGKL